MRPQALPGRCALTVTIFRWKVITHAVHSGLSPVPLQRKPAGARGAARNKHACTRARTSACIHRPPRAGSGRVRAACCSMLASTAGLVCMVVGALAPWPAPSTSYETLVGGREGRETECQYTSGKSAALTSIAMALLTLVL